MTDTTVLFLAQSVILYLLLYATHALRRRITIAPLYILIGAMTWVMWWVTDAGVKIDLLGYSVLIGSTVYFSAIILAVFIIYLFDEPQVTRRSIGIVIGVSIVVPITSLVIRAHAFLDPGTTLIHVPIPDLRINTASICATTLDLIVLVVLWKFLTQKAPNLPLWARSFLTLLAVMWLDVIIFGTGAFMGADFYPTYLKGTLAIRFWTLLIIFPFLWLYISLQRSKYPLLDGEPTAREVFSSISNVQSELINTRETLDRLQRSERRLREHEQLLRTVTANYPNSLIFVVDKGLSIEFASGQTLTNQKRYTDPLVGKTLELVMGLYPPHILDIFEQTFQGESHEFEVRINDRHQLHKTVPLPEDDGSVARILIVIEDISEQKRIDEALRASETLKTAILNNSPVGVSVRDINGTLMLANKAWQKIWDVTDEQLSQRRSPREKLAFTDQDSYLGEHLQGVRGVYENGGQYYVPEVKPLLPRPGKAEWISQFFYAIQDETGQVDKIVILTEDVTDRKKAEQELVLAKEQAEENEARFKALHNASFGGITIHDKGMILDCNQGLAELSGYSVDELIGMDGLLLIASESRDMVLANIAAGYEEPYEAMGVRKNGETYPLRLEAREIPYRGKRVRVVEFRDITAEKSAEEALKDSHAKQKAMIEKIADVISIVDNQGVFLYVSPNVERWLGWQSEDLIGSNSWDFIHDEDRTRLEASLARTFKKDNAVVSEEYRYRRKDGTFVWIESTATNRNRDKNIQGILFNSRDISERKQAEKERLELEQQLLQSQKLEAVGTMIGGIAHDFNNILQSMLLYADVVQYQLPDDEELKHDFQKILDSVDRARNLVGQILTFSRKSDVSLEPRTLHEIVLEVLAFQIDSLPANILIEPDIDVNCGRVLCDKTQIHQIVLNLINNAKHAIGEQTGLIQVSLKKSPESSRKMLELKVQDTGHGMNPETLSRIFDPFFTTKGVNEGTGLGLSMVHGIVQLMKGQIDVSSDPGVGTTVQILLPITETIKEDPEQTETAVNPRPELNILVVDDEQSIRIATGSILRKAGFTVDLAESGAQALDLVKSRSIGYDLIITDLTMPNMSGMELVFEVKKIDPQVLFVVSTGNLGLETKTEYSELGINGFLQKPWTSAQLLNVISSVTE